MFLAFSGGGRGPGERTHQRGGGWSPGRRGNAGTNERRENELRLQRIGRAERQIRRHGNRGSRSHSQLVGELKGFHAVGLGELTEPNSEGAGKVRIGPRKMDSDRRAWGWRFKLASDDK